MSKSILVIPCYNEERRLNVSEFRRFVSHNSRVQLLFVNDGSTDGSLQMLSNLQHAAHNCSVLDLPHNMGKAEAVRQGILEALRRRAEFVGFWDADLATPLNAAEKFVQVLEHHEQILAVIGSRVRMLGHRIERTFSRRTASRLFNTAASLVLGTSIVDSQCGAKMFRNTPEVKDAFSKPFRSRWIFDVEVLARLRAHRPLRDSVYECPLDDWHHVQGSKLRGKDFLRAVFELYAIWRTCPPAFSVQSSPQLNSEVCLSLAATEELTIPLDSSSKSSSTDIKKAG